MRIARWTVSGGVSGYTSSGSPGQPGRGAVEDAVWDSCWRSWLTPAPRRDRPRRDGDQIEVGLGEHDDEVACGGWSLSGQQSPAPGP